MENSMEKEVFNKVTKSDVFKIDPRAIKIIEGFNSRIDFGDIEELAMQIAEQGVLNPITVRKSDVDENGNQTYELVDGERRYRAVMHLIENGTEVARIPALIVNKNITQENMLLQQLMRNEGKPFNEYEYGLAYQKLVNLGFTRDEITKKCGKKNRWHVDCCLKHLERDEQVQELLRTNKIKGTEVRSIYQAHKGDEAGAVAEILGAKKRVEEAPVVEGEKKATKITLNDLDGIQSKTLLKRDTASIKKGLELLFKYYNQVTDNGKVEIELDVVDLLGQLKEDVDKNIVDVLNGYKATA